MHDSYDHRGQLAVPENWLRKYLEFLASQWLLVGKGSARAGWLQRNSVTHLRNQSRSRSLCDGVVMPSKRCGKKDGLKRALRHAVAPLTAPWLPNRVRHAEPPGGEERERRLRRTGLREQNLEDSARRHSRWLAHSRLWEWLGYCGFLFCFLKRCSLPWRQFRSASRPPSLPSSDSIRQTVHQRQAHYSTVLYLEKACGPAIAPACLLVAAAVGACNCYCSRRAKTT